MDARDDALERGRKGRRGGGGERAAAADEEEGEVSGGAASDREEIDCFDKSGNYIKDRGLRIAATARRLAAEEREEACTTPYPFPESIGTFFLLRNVWRRLAPGGP